MVSMNTLTDAERTQIVTAIVEGNSIRATSRMTGFSKNTITKLLVELGDACIAYQDKALRNLNCKRIQADELWSFCYAKDKNVPEEKRGKFGYEDVWTWIAIDADTKLIPSFFVGDRDAESAYEFMHDLADRLAHRVQLTTDGHTAYLTAVEEAFGADIDYAMLVKIYGSNPEKDTRYSPAECIGCVQKTIAGRPDSKHVSTSYAERQNLTMRMSLRRFTRLTNAFSKKIENHIAAIGIYLMYYNFARVHQTLRVTPAMEAGVSDRVWAIQEVIGLLPKRIFKARGSYKKKISN